jgi:predicted helicase
MRSPSVAKRLLKHLITFCAPATKTGVLCYNFSHTQASPICPRTPMPLALKPTDKLITKFYSDLQGQAQLHLLHEGAVAPSFGNLLADCAKRVGYSFTHEYTQGKMRFDGVVFTPYNLTFGIWEAKDTKDDLQKEIEKKFKKGYPQVNILFQSPNRAILVQNGQTVADYDITQPSLLARILEQFFNFVHPQYDQWEKAVADFKDRVPQVAQELDTLIETTYLQNHDYKTAFLTFFELCRQSINPNLNKDAVEEMLIQHIMTERIFQKVLNNPDFVTNNPIAVELEKVVRALTKGKRTRNEFLAPLEPFYGAIEQTANTIKTYGEKQGFLNTVYERFFQGFSTKSADVHGIVYTPQPIVDFMVQSVEHILQREWGKRMADPKVHILDPFVGTGNFILRVIQQIIATKKSALPQKYTDELHCNEIMLLPYYIASMNIENAYYEAIGKYEPFGGVCLVDTFELYEGAQKSLPGLGGENTERVKKQQAGDVFVVIGNPPYNAAQINENDNNKNRKYPKLDKRVQETYAKASTATNRNTLSDPYVKAFRWATERIGDEGVVAFVTNNSFLDSIAFDGMRQHLANDFSSIYHINFKGNARTSGERRRKEGGNLFDDAIRVSVGITFLVKRKGHVGDANIYIYSVDDYLKAFDKLAYLTKTQHVNNVAWQKINPNGKNLWLTEGMRDEWGSLLPLGTKEAKAGRGDAIFEIYSAGAQTNRDTWAFNFDHDALSSNMRRMIDIYNIEVYRWTHRGDSQVSLDDFVTSDEKRIKWSSSLKEDLMRGQNATFAEDRIRRALYRPFTRQYLFFDPIMTHRQGQFPIIFPTPETEKENRVICTVHEVQIPFSAQITNTIPALHYGGRQTQCFPLYTYDADGTNRKDNISDWALKQFRAQYGENVTKEDIFYYVYALLHHPTYRERYAQDLKKELARVPLTPKSPLPQQVGERGLETSPQPSPKTTPPLTPTPPSGEGDKNLAEKSPSSMQWGQGDLGDGGSVQADGGSVFHYLASLGRRLADLHLNYENITPYQLIHIENNDVSPSYRVEKMKLITPKDEGDLSVQINSFLTLTGIPRQVLGYQLGNRSALEWVIDQYQVTTDKRSGITNDPNRPTDEQYIVRLVGQVVAVSLQTIQTVEMIGAVEL